MAYKHPESKPGKENKRWEKCPDREAIPTNWKNVGQTYRLQRINETPFRRHVTFECIVIKVHYQIDTTIRINTWNG